jgi:CRISPR-associated protein Cas2
MVAPRPFRTPPLQQPLLPPAQPLPRPRTRTEPTATAPVGDWFPPLRPSPSDLSGHRCGSHQMLTLVAYDISEPKRLQRVARICEDWGMRLQYSVFECRLEADAFDRFWSELTAVIEPQKDKLTAFKICTKCAREIRSYGVQEHYEKVVAYVC